MKILMYNPPPGTMIATKHAAVAQASLSKLAVFTEITLNWFVEGRLIYQTFTPLLEF